jgi:4-amino-4-deoxy-L-arabinose transferase-like glycosyltransferase
MTRLVNRLRATSTFQRRLALVVVLAAGVRVAYAVAGGGEGASYDGAYYHLAANRLADGDGLVHPFTGDATAMHPPGWPLVVALPSLVGLDSLLAHQTFAALVSTTTVVLVALAARRIAGERVGLIAAAIVALYPNTWLRSRELAAETLVFPLVALALILAYRYWEAPRGRTLAGLAAVCAALALVRAEQVLLLGLLLPYLALRAPGGMPVSRRLAALGAATGVALCVLAPWFVRNAVRFDEPVTLTTSLGVNLRASNCEGAYYGERLGSHGPDAWQIGEAVTPGGCSVLAEGDDESVQDVALRQDAVAYVGDNVDRVPAVVAARMGRTWGAFRPWQEARFGHEWGGGPLVVYQAGLVAYWVLVAAAVAGAVALRRASVPLFPLLSFVVVVIAAVAVAFGAFRFRAPAEVPIAVLAAAGVDALWRRAARRRAVDERDA